MKLNPTVFTRAAEIMETGEPSEWNKQPARFACIAIERAHRDKSYTKFFQELFNPEGDKYVYWDSDEPEGDFKWNTPQGKDARIFALYLAAEICKDS